MDSDIQKALRQAQVAGMVVIHSGWLARAILLRHPNLTVQLAWSIPYKYSKLDIALAERGVWN